MKPSKSNKRKINNQRLIPFGGVSTENLEFDFTSVSKEEFNEIVENNILELEFELPHQRKRKWTIETLVNEIKKYKTLDDFKKDKLYLWTIYKQLVLIERKNTSTIDKIENKNLLNNANINESTIKTKQISVLEYSQKINPAYFRNNRKNPELPITRHTIMYRIRNNMTLPEVVKCSQIGKVHVLTVLADF